MRKTSAGTRNARQVPNTHKTSTTNECAVVDSFLKLLVVLRFTGMAGVHTQPRFGSPHRDTDIHQQVVINSGRAPITACVTGSTRVLDELFRDEGFDLCFSSVTDSSVMQMRPVRMNI